MVNRTESGLTPRVTGSENLRKYRRHHSNIKKLSSLKTTIVVGAGAWGGWTAYMLQKSGVQVTLIDQLGAGNVKAGSGGKTRVIRMAYGGHQLYTRLTARSFELWSQYEQAWQTQFYHETGSLWLFRGIEPTYAQLSQPLLRERGLQLSELSLEEAKAQYPQVNFSDISSVFEEPKSGYLEASRACGVVKSEFEKIGGHYRNARVQSLQGEGAIEAIQLDNGEHLSADAYVLACGPWTSELVPHAKDLIHVSRQEVYFFEQPPAHGAEDLPIWIEFREGEHMYYGIPGSEETGFKMAYDERTWALHPDIDHREVTPEILNTMRPILANRFPALDGASLKGHHTCVYESSPDGDFIMDKIPGFSNGIMLCGSSGHGFKMGPAIGELVAESLVSAKGLPVEFSLKRFDAALERKTQYQVS